jgi:hypothetical protein
VKLWTKNGGRGNCSRFAFPKRGAANYFRFKNIHEANVFCHVLLALAR